MKIHVEIYLASRLLQREKGTFSARELIERLRDEFGDTRPGVGTRATADSVANAPRHGAVVYNYLWRLDNGDYRCFDPAHDEPHSLRMWVPSQPEPRDVPKRYRYLLGGQAFKKPLPPPPTVPVCAMGTQAAEPPSECATGADPGSLAPICAIGMAPAEPPPVCAMGMDPEPQPAMCTMGIDPGP